VNSLEDGPAGPKHVEIRRYMNKIETVTSVGFLFLMLKSCTVKCILAGHVTGMGKKGSGCSLLPNSCGSG